MRSIWLSAATSSRTIPRCSHAPSRKIEENGRGPGVHLAPGQPPRHPHAFVNAKAARIGGAAREIGRQQTGIGADPFTQYIPIAMIESFDVKLKDFLFSGVETRGAASRFSECRFRPAAIKGEFTPPMVELTSSAIQVGTVGNGKTPALIVPPTVPNVLSLIGNTPMVELREFDTGPCRLFVKLENQNPGGSIKDRMAMSMIEA